MKQIYCEDAGMSAVFTRFEQGLINMALEIIVSKSGAYRNPMTEPKIVKDYLRLLLAGKEREEFVALWIDAQNHLIASETLFVGTATQASVYPREVVKAALKQNACAVIFAHNHPSGIADPSEADIRLTEALKKALAMVDIRVLDHIVVGSSQAVSMAERGLI